MNVQGCQNFPCSQQTEINSTTKTYYEKYPVQKIADRVLLTD